MTEPDFFEFSISVVDDDSIFIRNIERLPVSYSRDIVFHGETYTVVRAAENVIEIWKPKRPSIIWRFLRRLPEIKLRSPITHERN